LSGDNPRSRSARSPARASLWRGALAIEKRRRRTNASGVENLDLTTSPDASTVQPDAALKNEARGARRFFVEISGYCFFWS
jgi:hypothetical protein